MTHVVIGWDYNIPEIPAHVVFSGTKEECAEFFKSALKSHPDNIDFFVQSELEYQRMKRMFP